MKQDARPREAGANGQDTHPLAGGQVLVLIPAHNEDHAIGNLVTELRRLFPWPIVVIDDASTDATASRAEAAGARVLSLPFRVGAWGAVQTGIRYAVDSGCSLALTMDGDGQHLPHTLESLVAEVASGRSDVAIGAYTQRAGFFKSSLLGLFRTLTGLPVEDLTSGLRAYNRSSLELLASPGATLLEYQDVGVLLLLRGKGLRIREIPVEMARRRNGRSRVFPSIAHVARYILHTLVISLSSKGDS